MYDSEDIAELTKDFKELEELELEDIAELTKDLENDN